MQKQINMQKQIKESEGPALNIRFAPSPNGYLHLGHVYSALISAELAAQFGAVFLLRLEDIDQTRCRAEYSDAIFDDLAWLGLQWPEPVRRQSEHFTTYQTYLDRLEHMGLLYPCFATRKEIKTALQSTYKTPQAWPRDPDGAPLYPGLYRTDLETSCISTEKVQRLRATGHPYALRLNMAKAHHMAREKNNGPLTYEEFTPTGTITPHACTPERWGDVILARKDVPTSYHLAVVVDDALQNISHVTRGEDLRAATDIHRVLQILLDLPAPLYHHHSLILDDLGEKLAKSRKSETLQSLRKQGVLREEIMRRIGFAPRALFSSAPFSARPPLPQKSP